MPRSGPRPHCRKYPDEIDNKLFTDCMKARAQAWYMGQEWTITEDEYIELWRINDRYKRKGRGNDEYCLVRRDYDLGWHLNNVEIVTRLEHYQICSREKIGKFAERKRKKESVKNV
ncbi:hypothetical protein UFOVP389_13 [uncultured Caudovirales phage]|uniref:Uncharacterized protein n=1 Tax=uncultured Caudovirales phage TaxID=2100421 RepID=A0A6J7X0Y8_9CAUD|nr:hypothetical protein UFOVP389_13 [uncultured Caudovirales phage]